MSSLVVEEIAHNIGVPEALLNKECSEEHVIEISCFLESWQTLAPHLSLAKTVIEEIEDEKKLPVKRLKTLQKWKDKFICNATYKVLMKALLKIGNVDNARSVCELLRTETRTNGSTESDGAALNTPSTMDGASSTNKAFSRQSGMPSNTAEEAPQIGTSLPQRLEDEIHGLEEEFDKIVDQAASDIESSIENGKTSFSRIKRRITQLPVSMKHLHIKFVQGKLSAINDAKNVDEFFFILGQYWDFMNCGLLQRLVNKGESSETQQKMEKYLKRLKEFRTKTTVREFIDKWTGNNIPCNLTDLEMEMGDDWLDRSLEEVEEFRTKFSRQCSFTEYALPLKKGKHNSVILCFALQRSFPLNAKILQPSQQFLQEQGVLRVLFKGVCLLQLAQIVPSVEGTTTGGYIPTVQRGEGYESQISMDESSKESKAMEHLVQHIHEQQQMISSQSDDQHSQEQEEFKLQQQDPQDLFRACMDGDLDKVLKLLSAGLEVDCRDEDGDTVLHWACIGGHSNMVEVLLQEGAEVDSRNEAGGTPLMYASSNGHAAVVKLLLDARADVNLQVLDKSTALIKASDNGHSKVVELLLDAHADVNTQNQDGITALMEACSRGYRNVVDLLLGRGADPSLQDQNGETALLKASYFCRSEIVQRLLHDGANVNTETKASGDVVLGFTLFPIYKQNGLTPLMLTVKSIDPEVEKQLRITRDTRLKTVEVLLDANAAVNAQEQSTKRTALFFAVMDGDLDLVQLLLHYGADCKIIDAKRVTALDVARVHGYNDICEELERYGQERPPAAERKQSLIERVQTGGQRALDLFRHFFQERILNRKDKTKNPKSAKKRKSRLTTTAQDH